LRKEIKASNEVECKKPYKYKDYYSIEEGRQTLKLDKIEVKKRQSFSDFIAGGCEIKLSVAVDLTSSNDNHEG
jgi:hypothetical protein